MSPIVTRRNLLKGTLTAATVGVLSGGPPQAGEATDTRYLRGGVNGCHLMPGAEFYVAIDNKGLWPNLTRLANGELSVAVYNHPSHGYGSNSDVELWMSPDGGRNWTFRSQITDHPENPNAIRMNHAVGLNADGELVAIVSGYQEGQKLPMLRPQLCISSDQGHTWDRRLLDFDGVPFGDIFPLPDGSLVCSTYARPQESSGANLPKEHTMKSAKVLLTLAAATIALGWGVSQWNRTTAADTSVTNVANSPAVIDASRYPSLQAAFDAVPMTGGLVRLPPGDFRLNEPLVLERPETRIEGAGAATRLINCNQEGKPALIVRPPGLAANPKAFVWRVQLADFRICGDPDVIDAKSTEPKGGDGLLAQRVNELYIEGLSVDHITGNNFSDRYIGEGKYRSNSDDPAAGIELIGTEDVAISGNVFAGLNRQAIEADAECRRIVITGNVMTDLNRKTEERRPALDLHGNQDMIVEHNGVAK